MNRPGFEPKVLRICGQLCYQLGDGETVSDNRENVIRYRLLKYIRCGKLKNTHVFEDELKFNIR